MILRRQNIFLTGLAALGLCLISAATFSAQQSDNSSMSVFLEARLANVKTETKSTPVTNSKFEQICPVSSNGVARRVFDEYGSVFAVKDPARFPDKCIFSDIADVERFQRSVKTRSAAIGGVAIELQEAAMNSLLEVVKDADSLDLKITPLDGARAGKRSYIDTVGIWNSRFQRALDHWVKAGKITDDEATAVRNMNTEKQVTQVAAWESSGLFFSTDFSRSIFSSTAPPGTSQHLSMLAIDIVEHDNPMIVTLLAGRGWYRTVLDDPTHFTFIGVPESQLPSRGLKSVTKGHYTFWIPNTATSLEQNESPVVGPGE
jgi:hypothetical protein